MNILHVIVSVDPRHGGPVEATRLSVGEMTARGHHVEVVSLDAPNTPYLRSFPSTVTALGPGRGRYGYSPRLADWIATNGPRFDAAIIHGLWNHGSIGGWRGARRAHLPYVVFAHGMLDPWFRRVNPAKHLVKQAYWLLAQGWVLRQAATVLFTTEAERRLARGAFWGPGYSETVVAFAADDLQVDADAPRDALDQAMPDLAGRPYLLYLSRLHPKKGCDLLINAFAKVATRHPQLQLVMAGPDQEGIKTGLQRLAIRGGIADRVYWPGMLTGPARIAAFRHAEAFILPSHQENFGIVVAEAMSAARPVLISNQVNIWHEVDACGGGLVRDDTQDGTSALLQDFFAMTQQQRTVMGERARAGYLRHFSVDRAITDLLDALKIAVATK